MFVSSQILRLSESVVPCLFKIIPFKYRFCSYSLFYTTRNMDVFRRINIYTLEQSHSLWNLEITYWRYLLELQWQVVDLYEMFLFCIIPDNLPLTITEALYQILLFWHCFWYCPKNALSGRGYEELLMEGCLGFIHWIFYFQMTWPILLDTKQ